VAHETAHQWFGDAVTERDWGHLWLSEGFASYFEGIFTQRFLGDTAFRRELAETRAQIVESPVTRERPVLDTAETTYMRLLNTNSYQKGAWTLHMLRYSIGTDRFWEGIREYYRRYQNRNASTDDLRDVMERVSGANLQWFFSQWLTRSGVPAIAGTWSYDAAAQQIVVELKQTQAGDPYRLPLEIGVSISAQAAPRIERAELTGRDGRFTFAADAEPAAVTLDPNTWVLMEPPQFARK
jgi:aminopeptidase N